MSTNPATATVTRAAPKTLHQVRNLCYVIAAYWGYRKGFNQKQANDAQWKKFHDQIQHNYYERAQIVESTIKAREDALHPKTIPALIPQPLHEVYTELTGATA